jgi:phenylacetaldehyde dehydrogenase
VADAIAAHAERLATLVTQEQGRPLGGVGPGQVPGSRFELWGCEAWTRATASLELAPEVVFEDETRRDEAASQALWRHRRHRTLELAADDFHLADHPGALRRQYGAQALRIHQRMRPGTGAVIAGALPPGVLNTVSGDGSVGALLVEDPHVNKIMFTGSGATGARIVAAAARNLTPTTMELGGNDAAIVLDDADPKAIAGPVLGRLPQHGADLRLCQAAVRARRAA